MKRSGSKGAGKSASKAALKSGVKSDSKAAKPARKPAAEARGAHRASGGDRKLTAVSAPERRRHARSARGRPDLKAEVRTESCAHCDGQLKLNDRALFVEEELGRVFCSEACIADFFTQDIERLEKEYFKFADHEDFTSQERESLAHLRWITLEEPDEIWREKTLAGDYRYFLISEFKPGEQPGDRKVWYICICLFLRGEPSFLFMAFPTRSHALLERYRRGERIRKIAKAPYDPKQGPRVGAGRPGTSATDANTQASRGRDGGEGGGSGAGSDDEKDTDRLAADWTIEESFLAGLALERTPEDIQPADFVQYQWCLEDTLESPDELWSLVPHVHGGAAPDAAGAQLYHFIKKFDPQTDKSIVQHFADAQSENESHSLEPFWFLVVARETENDEEIEILDAAPTRDPHLVNRYRQGDKEAVEDAPTPSAHTVH